MQRNVGLQSATDGEFRRASWHMDFIYQIGGVSKAPGNLAVKFHNPSGDIEFTPAALHVGTKIHMARTIFEEDFTYLQVAGRRRHREADDPVAEHGPLPRRPRRDRPGGLPGHRGVLERPVRRLRRRGRPAGRPGLHLPAVRRHQPGLPERPGAAGRDRRARRGRRPPAPALHPPGQRRPRGQARRDGGHHAPVPGQLPVLVGRVRRVRLRRRGAVQRAERGRVLPGVRRRAVRRLRAAAVRAAGQDGRARPGHHQARRAGGPGHAQAADRRGGEVRAAGPALPVPAVRLLLDRRGQRAELRPGGGQARADRQGRPGTSGASQDCPDPGSGPT